MKVSVLHLQQLCWVSPLAWYSSFPPAVRGGTPAAVSANCAIGEHCMTQLVVVASQGLSQPLHRMLYKPAAPL